MSSPVKVIFNSRGQINDVEDLIAVIEQRMGDVVHGVFSTVVREGEDLAKLAKSYAPVDEGNLEDAIKTKELARRDARGRFVAGRKSFQIYVDGDVAAPAFNKDGSMTKGTYDKVVGDYAIYMHEGLAPYGSGLFQLGPRSKAKAAAGNAVGGKFLERALDNRTKRIIRSVNQIAREILR